ncbi:MAG: glycosyltransferase family 2 protein [Candidatus Omnitrophota bacterium]
MTDSITVAISCYKEGELMRRAYSSLEAQTDRDFEILIINDASTDAITNAICDEFGSAGRARVIRHAENGGLSRVRNTSFGRMKGTIHICLDADDTLPPRTIEVVRKAFREHPEADFVFGNFVRRDVEKGEERIVDCGVLSDGSGFLDPRQLTNRLWRLYGGSPCRKALWERLGGYRQPYSYTTQDMDFWMRALISGAKGYYVNETIYEWNRSETGMNSSAPVSAWLSLMYADNSAFMDMFSGDSEWRDKAIGTCLRFRDFDTAKEIARRRIKQGRFKPLVFALSIIPTRPLYLLYGAYRKIRGLYNRKPACPRG